MSTSALAFIDPEEARILAFSERRRRQYNTWGGLALFVRDHWHELEAEPLVWGRHLDAICLHLEACSFGLIEDLIINIPPGHMKSLLVGVFWPAWEWTRRPAARFLSASHNIKLAVRDARKMRKLVQSATFQLLYPIGVTELEIVISPDQNEKQRFENTKGGYRIVTSSSTGTGEGANHIVIDDPHNALDVALSDADREAVLTWWKETASQRQRPPGSGARVVVMQRLHEEDLAGYLLDQGGWVHLCLPAEFEEGEICETIRFPWMEEGEVWTDWRTREGELLWPELFGAKQIAKSKKELGSTYAIAGQLQQRPSPRGGGIIKRHWWKPYNVNVDTGGVNEYPPFELIFCSVDTAFEEDEINDPSACTVWGIYVNEHGRYRVMMIYAWEERLEFNALIEKLSHTAKRWKATTMLIEKKASGASVIQEIRRRKLGHKGMSVLAIEPRGDKVARLVAQSGIVENGYITAPGEVQPNGQIVWRNWAFKVIDRCAKFPAVKHKDLVDTTSQALMWLRVCGIDLFDEDYPASRDYPKPQQEAALY